MTNNDELEYQKFEYWYTSQDDEYDPSDRTQVYLKNAAWLGWQARAKQESNHDS